MWKYRYRAGAFLSTFPRRERPSPVAAYGRFMTFLSTFPRRERHSRNRKTFNVRPFLSTFPRRERLIPRAFWHFIQIFLSTFPRRERPGPPRRLQPSRYFYPRSHVGNDDRGLFPGAPQHQFLSTFPRRERRLHPVGEADAENISIHVPT